MEIIEKYLFALYLAESKDLFVDEGKTITFDLPSVTKCGNYQFLNPQLSPLIIIKNQSAAAIQGGYVKRTSVYVLENSQLRLTLQNVTPVDRGKYSVFTKTGDTLQCSKINYYLNVQGKQFFTYIKYLRLCFPSLYILIVL